MRVLQVIDSLRPGGAERMAVSYAKLLHKNGHASYLCSTRFEGILKENLNPDIGYLFLNKKYALDFTALNKLRKYIKNNKIEIVHAHSSSYLFAALLKLTGLSFKLVWHDHYGESELLHQRKFRILKIFSKYFDGIISVNHKLKNWAVEKLKTEDVTMINNFIHNKENRTIVNTLEGPADAFKIICLANLRPQKDHQNLLRSFELLPDEINATLHLIGNDPKTSYSKEVLKLIEQSKSRNRIFYYGIQTEIIEYLGQADLGVLSSRSEGLPVALLEYGVAGLPVIVTNVGQCKEVLNGYGLVVIPNNSEIMSEAILEYYEQKKARLEDALNFQRHVLLEYGEDVIYKNIIEFYSTI
ncbi:glycosyltransferase [Gillisia sp. CAL575]|uniref:glycosyltransferase n=1 Tax=Gillisia sp. CAL575 TaxID=985255 RepID=UPI00039D40D9|nr:glycosyltransferase [Gillisia sp. CAL575]